jgi:succinoglycan biosynthesis transport protein ExoP
MRSIKSATDLSVESIKVLGFTSALSSEGKSTIGGACALLAAHMGSRVVLLDCDLRNPVLTAELAPGAEFGILDVISGKKSLEDVLWRDPKTGLAFLPGATKSRVAHSSEILISAAVRTFLGELRHSYDYVIIDLPPLAPIVDVRSTAGLVDAYVFVVEWGRTRMDVAELALKKAPMVHERLLGVALNKVDFKTLRRYEGYRSDYYSEKLYAQYGG